jgi:hypothetical protein
VSATATSSICASYNDSVLSFGSPPVRYARAMLLELPIE